jgi:hypothetical protein
VWRLQTHHPLPCFVARGLWHVSACSSRITRFYIEWRRYVGSSTAPDTLSGGRRFGALSFAEYVQDAAARGVAMFHAWVQDELRVLDVDMRCSATVGDRRSTARLHPRHLSCWRIHTTLRQSLGLGGALPSSEEAGSGRNGSAKGVWEFSPSCASTPPWQSVPEEEQM